MHLTLLVLRCSDIKQTKAFYERLGMEFIQEQHGNSPIHYATQMGEMLLELYPSKDEYIDNTRLGFALEVEDVNNFLVAQNIAIVSSYCINDKKVYVVVDPDGRRVEIKLENK